jgi:uncharacterized protein (TIGR02996 family)
MSDAAAFVQAMRDAPDDEAVRLVFADWLEERGDPRGEFLRIQVELARWVPNLARRTRLKECERELLARHGREWIGPLADVCLAWRFVGGLAHITMSPRRFGSAAFAAHAEEWFSRAWVSAVRLSGRISKRLYSMEPPYASPLVDLDLSDNDLAHLPRIALTHFISISPYGPVPYSPRGPRRLNLANNLFTDHHAAAPHVTPALEGLAELDVHNNHLTDRGVCFLLSSPLGSRLRRLDVSGNDLSAETRRRLSAWHEGRDPARVINSLGMELVRIPSGTFLMGSPDVEPHRYDDEGPLHEVTLSKPFFLSVYPVTQQCYLEVMGRNSSHFHTGNGGGPWHPVDSVSWEDAVRFCRLLSEHPLEKRAGRVYRLPTEAEWEHACRAGSTTPFWWGDAASSYQANFDGNHPYGGAEEGPVLNRTQPVGCYAANPFGLYDMHGNIWEWCHDWYGKHYYRTSPPVDPPGPESGEFHVLRGGCWQHLGACTRAAYRLDHPPGGLYQGFRVALK